ncbi:MAG: hypothetical protein HGA27_08835 [Peptococcaceae bacterium]|nr:hypothetical protein [Peptococcaceae bacterium]
MNWLVEKLQQKITELSNNIERIKLGEYLELLNKPGRLLWVNFISGIARGLGIAVGFAILGAFMIIVMEKLVNLNIPLIGGFIADIVRVVQQQLGSKTY